MVHAYAKIPAERLLELSDDPPPAPEARPVMAQRWENVTFLHWPTPTEVVKRSIHPDLEPDTFDGTAWVGLVPFRMVGIGLPKLLRVPYLGTFAETNVRTYVKGPHGPGVWFDSLDASRLLPVAIARLGYRLPYFHSSMRIGMTDDTMRYNTIRRWPGPRGVGGAVAVKVGWEVEPSPLDVFFTARWRLYTSRRGKLFSAEVRHPAWPLRSAGVLNWDGELIVAAGYPTPEEQPRALYSPGVPVEVYPPRQAG